MSNFDLTKLKKPVSKEILTNAEDTAPPPRAKELLTAKKIMLSLRPSERQTLEILAEEESLPLSTLVRKLLKKHGYI